MNRREVSIKIPTVHMNGTSYQDLFDQAMDARSALKNALDLMRRMTPNGRDYYVQGDGATEQARDEHSARIQSVASVVDEIEHVLMGIADQKPAGRSR
jgi:hypothetical protein